MVITLHDLTGWTGPEHLAPVSGLAIDHRKVTPGTIFGAFPGVRFNGEDFIEDAIAAGAVAIVARPEAKVDTARASASPKSPRGGTRPCPPPSRR